MPQVVHSDAPVAPAYVPPGHAFLIPSTQYDPMSHAVHTVAGSLAVPEPPLVYEPAGQVLQLDDVEAAHFLSSLLVQAKCIYESENVHVDSQRVPNSPVPATPHKHTQRSEAGFPRH